MGKMEVATVSSDQEWQCEDDLRTLCKAMEIQADPKRMKKCKEMAGKKMKEMAAATK
jgi:hypothetical protein